MPRHLLYGLAYSAGRSFSISQGGNSAQYPVGGAATVPGTMAQPSTLGATADSITVGWALPSDNGGSEITSYDLRYSSDGGSNWLTMTGLTGTSYVLTGLADATLYGIEVKARNAIGLAAAWSPTVSESTLTAHGSQSVTIHATRTSGMAPAGIAFEAVAVGFTKIDADPVYPLSNAKAAQHELHYEWNFGDTISPDFTAPHTNKMRKFGLSSNTARGYMAAHVFAPNDDDWIAHGAGPMTFNVTCTVRSAAGEIAASNTLTISVENPAEIFSEAETVVLAPDGDFTGAPPGTQVVGNNIYTALRNGQLSKRTRRRLRVKRGSAGLIGVNGGLDASDVPTRVLVDTWGSDPNPPEISVSGTESGFNPNSTLQELAVRGLDIRGDLDENDPDASPDTGGISLGTANSPVTFYDVRVFDVASPIVSFGAAEGKVSNFVSNCAFYRWQSYGCYMRDGVGFVGNMVESTKTGKQSFGSPGGAAIRMVITGNGDNLLNGSILQKNTVFSNVHNQAFAEVQSCIRINTGAKTDAKTVVTECVLEGGSPVLVSSSGSGFPPNRHNLVIDAVILMATGAGNKLFSCNNMGTTIKNWIGLVAGDHLVENGSGEFIQQIDLSGKIELPPDEARSRGQGETSTLNKTGHFHCYDFTVINLKAVPDDMILDQALIKTVTEPVENTFYGDRLYHAPRYTGKVSDLSASLNLTELFDEGDYRGLGNGTTLDTEYDPPLRADVDDDGTPEQYNYPWPVPTTLATAVGTRFSPVDILGNVRTASSKQGAIANPA